MSTPLVPYGDSQFIFDSVLALDSTAEKRLLIVLSILRGCYERRELTEIVWISSEHNPFDTITERNFTVALYFQLKSNKESLSAKVWVLCSLSVLVKNDAQNRNHWTSCHPWSCRSD